MARTLNVAFWAILSLCLLAQVGGETVEVKEPEWKQEVRQAQEGAAAQLQSNLLQVLSGLSQSAATRGRNVTQAVATLTKAIINNSFDLAGVVAYMPRLMLQDLPTQLTEVLQLVRRNNLRMPTDVNSAIDAITTLTRQSQESGIPENLFGPIIRFVPNLLQGIQGFLQTIFSNVFGFLGVTNTR